jgi:integrase
MPTLISKKRKKGTQWYIVENKKENGKQEREYLASLGYVTKAEAKIELAKFITLNKKTISAKVTFKQASEQYFIYYKELVGREIQERTYEIAKDHQTRLDKFLGNKIISEISEDTLERFKLTLIENTKLSNRSINMYLITAKKVIRYAIQRGWATDFPKVKSLPERYFDKEIEFLTKDEVQKILQHAKEREFFYINLVLFTGMRPQEVTALKWEHINLEKKYVDIYSNNTLKKGRRIPINKRLEDILKQKHPDDLSLRVSPYTTSRHASHRLKKLATLVDIKFTPYTLRKTFGSWLVQNGIGLLEVAELMGHRNIETTRKHYVRLIDENLKSAISKLDSIL